MKTGFTLIELLMAISILSIMMLLSFICFHTVTQSWTAGIEMSDSMAQADYVMNQIESALRSAYFSTTVQKEMERGFSFQDGGEGVDAHDTLEWMKLGRAFVGTLKDIDGKTELAEIPHRVRLYVAEEGDTRNSRDESGGLMAKAWCSDFRDEEETDDEREESIKAYLISPRVIAMDCKVLKEPPDANAKEIKWEDEWTSSNALPYKVSVTLYLKPLKERDDPIALTRDIEIPVWKYSQNPGSANGKTNSKTGTKRTDGKTGTSGQSGNSGQTGAPGNRHNPIRPGGGMNPGGGGMRPGAGGMIGPGGGGGPI